jgi:hypothetical protein
VSNGRLARIQNAMKHLLTVTAVIEAGAGLTFLVVPAVVVQLLLGADISGAGIPLGRVAGAALLALGVACWVARGDAQSRAAKGLVTAMLLWSSALPASSHRWLASCCGRRSLFMRQWRSGA